MIQRLLVILFILSVAACEPSGGKTSISSQSEKLSYTVGTRIAQGLKRDGIEIEAGALLQALQDANSGVDPVLTQDEMREVMQAHRTAQQEKKKAAGEQNKIEGEEFLAKNKEKEGVVTLESGLQYKIVEAGSGESPKPTDRVVAHYTGKLIDGTEFDSSQKRGQPATFPVMGVIKGWQEALQKMKKGAKWELYVPSDLGYGARGTGGDIGPNATLIFDIELIDILEPPKPADMSKSPANAMQQSIEAKMKQAVEAKIKATGEKPTKAANKIEPAKAVTKTEPANKAEPKKSEGQ